MLSCWSYNIIYSSRIDDIFIHIPHHGPSYRHEIPIWLGENLPSSYGLLQELLEKSVSIMERSFGQDTQPQKITILGGNSGKHHAKNDKKLEVSEKQVYQFTIVYHIKKNLAGWKLGRTCEWSVDYPIAIITLVLGLKLNGAWAWKTNSFVLPVPRSM